RLCLPPSDAPRRFVVPRGELPPPPAGPHREMGGSQLLPGLDLGEPVLGPLACHGGAPLHTYGCRVTSRLLGVAMHPGDGLPPRVARGEHGEPAIRETANPAQGRIGRNRTYRAACPDPYGDRT